jgi:hypothetical protein
LPAQTNNLTEEIRLLREENALLQKQVRQQGEQIGDLIQKVGSLESARVIEGGNDKTLLDAKSGLNKFNLGLEGGVGYAATGPDGSIPDGKFRVDEGRIFLEAPLWDDVYFLAKSFWPRPSSSLTTAAWNWANFTPSLKTFPSCGTRTTN